MGEVDGHLVKAFIRVLDEHNQSKVEDIPICFNPKEYSLEKSVTYAAGDAHTDNPSAEFKEAHAMTMSVNLQFDTYEERRSVRDAYMRRIEQLAMMRKDAKEERDATKYSPPTVIFVWGRLTFQGVVESLSQKYTMFLSDGTPVRAECSLRIRQTSGSAVDSAEPVTSTTTPKVTAADVKNSGASALRNSNIDNPKELLEMSQQKLGGAVTLSASAGPKPGARFDVQVNGPFGIQLGASGGVAVVGKNGIGGGLAGGLQSPLGPDHTRSNSPIGRVVKSPPQASPTRSEGQPSSGPGVTSGGEPGTAHTSEGTTPDGSHSAQSG